MEVEYFYTGKDIRVQIDEADDRWTKEGRFNHYLLFDELGDGELVQADEINDEAGRSLWIDGNGDLYAWYYSDIRDMLRTGFSIMYHIAHLSNYVDTSNGTDMDFCQWYYSVQTDKEVEELLAKGRGIMGEVEHWLRSEIYPKIGMDAPNNQYDIVKYIVDDVEATADPQDYHTGDFGIAFRRMLEELRF